MDVGGRNKLAMLIHSGNDAQRTLIFNWVAGNRHFQWPAAGAEMDVLFVGDLLSAEDKHSVFDKCQSESLGHFHGEWFA